MTPYYERDGITLYHADCRDVLATLTGIDCVVTDPPYGLGKRWNGGGGSLRSSWGFAPEEAKAWDSATVPFVESLPDFASTCIIWGGNYYRLPPSRCWLVWDKKVSDTFTTGQCELAWTTIDRPIRCFRFAQCEQANEGPKYHPTQKPLSLMEWTLKWVDGETICDPFGGSMTTGVAAWNLGRKAILCEISEEYCELGAKRLDRVISQGRLFKPEPVRETQTTLFEEQE